MFLKCLGTLFLFSNVSRPHEKQANANISRQVALWEGQRMWKYNLTYVGSAEQCALHLRQNGFVERATL